MNKNLLAILIVVLLGFIWFGARPSYIRHMCEGESDQHIARLMTKIPKNDSFPAATRQFILQEKSLAYLNCIRFNGLKE
ncbi:hypothetical protein FBR05_00405 [Deltaproteobacteria bacterium PRO3]|nr:hypothetical protein [Deltaproteobacteria bacterium PRO3]